MEVPKMLVK
jgi:hypothetical protein